MNPICLTSSFDLSETKTFGLAANQNNLGCNARVTLKNSRISEISFSD